MPDLMRSCKWILWMDPLAPVSGAERCPVGEGLNVSSDAAIALLSETLKLGLVLSLPLLGVILAVGLLISVVQVVTQVQDASVAFVPKLLLFVVLLALLTPWLLSKLSAFGVAMFVRLGSQVL